MGKFYVTTAIDYPSAPPHMGHAYEKIFADAAARWRRILGDDVFFLTGTDEHGQKIEKYASRAGKTPREFVDGMSLRFRELCATLDISNDDFIRTTEHRHQRVLSSLFSRIMEKGDIYPGEYEGLYCVDCEAFYTTKDLPGGKCPVHLSPPETVREKSYFFRLTAYAGPLLEHIKRNSGFILPASRRNEIINRLEGGARDLCISRSSFKWGVPVPGDSEHVIFVWFDALSNYVSALGYPSGKFENYWPCDLHVIGKDILWFHAVVWPALLMSAGLDLPRRVFVHGFVNVGGMKLSKSRGAGTDIGKLAEAYGADALRYFLLREIPSGEDGNFSEKALVTRLNNDLANDLGNLLSRTLSMIEKYFGGAVPPAGPPGDADKDVESACEAAYREACRLMEEPRPGEALAAVWKLITRLNKYVEETAPWNLAKEGRTARLGSVLRVLAEHLEKLSVMLFPFMPSSALRIRAQLGIGARFEPVDDPGGPRALRVKEGVRVAKGENLFDKIKLEENDR